MENYEFVICSECGEMFAFYPEDIESINGENVLMCPTCGEYSNMLDVI